MTSKLAAKLQTMLFVQKDKGATAVEYGLIVAAIAAVIVAIVFTLGGQINAAFTEVSDAITNKGVTTP
ncbi:Flp family type IVb pilin [Kribbia dieselivorans]|uniref:Flp family type IVb pilin n=1 Tax=Kribbia dieselivorans TaxID=331526 RepID=UPI00083942B7|nr:Flp family type IVb pilin [Kribbia dieselivorans]